MLNNSADSLPVPDEKAKEHSKLLQQGIKEACRQAGGMIKFSEFMNIALYEPGLGYYSSGLQKFGEKGDFITAPEVSPLFGQCLAKQLSEVLLNFEEKFEKKPSLIEFGAGSGVLAADILLELENLGCLPQQYLIIELSAELKIRQNEHIKKNAPHLLSLVQWLDELPDNIDSAIVVANEVLDAMPVECFKVTKKGTESLIIELKKNELTANYSAADDSVGSRLNVFQSRSEFSFTEGYCSEYNPAIAAWLAAIEDKVNNLVMFLIDYGYNEIEYYHPDRNTGTLMCYYQHKGHADFLWWPGLQDITAFVNFTDVAYSAVDLDMDVAGYTTQSAFLLANGLADLHQSQVTDDVQQQIKLSQQIKTLTLPSEMGDRFKVLALTKNYQEPLTGFSMLDLRNRL